MKIKKNDQVKITLGKDRGRTGTVKRVLPKKNKIVVEGINIAKKHVKPQGENQKGGIIKVEKPFFASKAMVICPSCKEPTRVGYEINDKGEKQRICRKCNKIIKF